ncbi:RNA polymerase sigma factor [Paenibacillus tarimensis]
MLDRNNGDMARALKEMSEGSVEAFELVYSRYAPLVFGLARRIMADQMEAEDLCHDVFLEAMRKGERYDPSRGSIEAWLAVMTRSRGMDRLRRKQRVIVDRVSGQEEGLRVNTERSEIEDRVVNRLQAEAVTEALSTLPAGQRRAVVHSYVADKTHRELSETFNVPIGTVKSWIRYGIKNVRRQMARRGWMEEPRGGVAGERMDS